MGASSEFQLLRSLLLAPEFSALQGVQVDLESLQREIHDPEQLIKLLQPAVAEVLQRADPAVSAAILRAITPVLDHAVRENVNQDAAGMSSALAPSSTQAVAIHYAQKPQAAAHDLAPLMSAAIKEQIRGERDAMIDALYPVIGSTISKYLSETLSALIQTVNERIESHLSFRGVARKIRARAAGVSEAELLLRESMPLKIEAAFLIHKSSGLLIGEAHAPDAPALDSELMSGMLTAIRSLFNESVKAPGSMQELDEIQYGESKIVLEVAGYFYIAAVVRGTPDDAFRKRLRNAVASIVQQPDDAVANFAGDPSAVPAEVVSSLRRLVDAPARDDRSHHPPYAVLAVAVVLLVLCGVFAYVHLHHDGVDRELETLARAKLLAAQPILLRNVTAEAEGGVLHLSGSTPNEYLRIRAGQLAGSITAVAAVDNQIALSAEAPLDVLGEKQVTDIIAAMNTMDGVYVDAAYRNGSLVVSGIAPDSSAAAQIARAFEGLPGIRSFRDDLRPGDRELGMRVLFELNSTEIRPGEEVKLEKVAGILARTPWSRLVVNGHSDRAGEEAVNRRVALGRAMAVAASLRALGVSERRISVSGDPLPPPGSGSVESDSLSRCVRFLLLPGEARRTP